MQGAAHDAQHGWKGREGKGMDMAYSLKKNSELKQTRPGCAINKHTRRQ